MTTSLSDAVAQTERALLGSILFDNSVCRQNDGPSVGDFSLDSHRRIYALLADMLENGQPADPTTLTAELDRTNQLEQCGGVAYIGRLIDDAMPKSFASYVDRVRTAAIERKVTRQVDALKATCVSVSRNKLETIRGQVQQLNELIAPDALQRDNWRTLFHTYEEIVNVPPVRFAIEGFLQEEGITLIGGLAGHGKTLAMLATVRALLEGGKLFHHFQVNQPAKRVIYLIPEAGLGPFLTRLRTFRLLDYVQDGRLFFRTLSAPGSLSLADSRLLDAVNGADVFLDTAVRFMVGDENSASEQKMFADTLFGLQRAGARTITGAHHSPKSFGKDSYMTLENVLRGSGDIGAMLCTCWGLSQINAATNSIFIQNVKPRDFQPCEPFIIQGRPSIDQTGYFELTHPPGTAGSLGDSKAHAGRPEMHNKDDKIRQAEKMHAEGKTVREIANAIGVSHGSVGGWLRKARPVQ